jgi:hypothetical protein
VLGCIYHVCLHDKLAEYFLKHIDGIKVREQARPRISWFASLVPFLRDASSIRQPLPRWTSCLATLARFDTSLSSRVHILKGLHLRLKTLSPHAVLPMRSSLNHPGALSLAVYCLTNTISCHLALYLIFSLFEIHKP